MRKWLLSLLVLIVIVSGCSNDAEKGETGKGIEDPGEVAGKITVWGWDVAAETLKLSVDKFKEEYPDVEVEVEDFNSGDLYEKLTVGLVSKGSGMPDVILMEDERIPGYVNQFPEGFLNLSEMGYDKHKALFSEAKLENVMHEDSIVAAPWDIGPTGVFYRVDLFEEAGVNAEDIVTWDDYVKAGIQIKDKLGIKMLPIDIAKYDGVFSQMMQQQGTSYFNENDEIDLTSEEAVRSMEMVKKLYDNDLVLNNSGWDGIVTATVNGEVATVPYGAWYTGTIMDQAPDLKGKWDMFYLPQFSEGGTRYGNVGGSAILVSAYSKNKNAAYAFTEFFTTDVDTQLLGFEKYGLFPSLKSTYDSPILTGNSAYFNNKPIFKNFADIVSEVPKVNMNKYNAQASQIMANAQASVLLEGTPVQEALEKAEKQLVNEIRE
ncbi:ABC transporter substrate-binding protein [Sporosarcina limicola]|uniref:Lactose/L-arabinose transport system substrate-binding protein n=1 Tax=Sporosarcina limicola TaxID=34101 RepID=A0A927MLS4_9BACL|nr:sugar ABC transporter substrate-binding protein [Sporosarcina limicola]MBE1556303.1 lactose/L-arabinose transport system substrate-binding protein [Sporosarcina limicola]